ncbi:hypothetical protein FO519_002148 [Halicephalobus sp. NKZ332]|nr:hypothetical protein FO519_002148 [Halicephalobus sp. NKZ332]
MEEYANNSAIYFREIVAVYITYIEQLPNMNETNIEFDETIETWIYTTHLLKWAVIIMGVGAIPVLFHTLYKVFTVYRRSQYFLFLSTIIILDLILLTTIIYNVVIESIPSALHYISCPITAYIVTATSCHSNWLFVCMYIQRYVYVSYPMSVVQSSGIWRIIDDSRKLIIYTGILSYTSQFWLLVLMKKQYIYEGDIPVVSFCGANLGIFTFGMLNLPCFIVQFLPEVIGDEYPIEQNPVYLYADAITYFIYLLQFPLKAVIE